MTKSNKINLNEEQFNQIQKQIQYHITSNPYEYLDLNANVRLKYSIHLNVTRPMSSKGIAKWLWSNNYLYANKKVLDIGTGCGIQGIVCKLGGADFVTCTDVMQNAINCTNENIKNILPKNDNTKVILSDLFYSLDENEKFDLIIFAQPYFSGKPIENFDFTIGMLNTIEIQNNFFENVRKYLKPCGKILMMGWNFAGKENNPIEVSKQHNLKINKVEKYFDWQGVQQGVFDVVLFEL